MSAEIATQAAAQIDTYASLTPELAAWLVDREAEIDVLIGAVAEKWVRVGLIYAEIRDRLPERQFRAWITLRSGTSKNTVYRRIEAAKVFGDLYEPRTNGTEAAPASHQNGTIRPIQNLTSHALNLLLDAPEEIQRQAKEHAVAGGKITPAIVRQMLSNHKSKQVSTTPTVNGRSNLIPRRIEEATLPMSTVSRFRIEGEVRLDPEGDKIVSIREEVIEDDSNIRSAGSARTVPEALENAADEIDGYNSSPPAIDPAPHEEWARKIGAGVASEYELKGQEAAEIEATAVKELVAACHRFEPSKVPEGGDAGGLLRGFAHQAIQKECRREGQRLRNGGTYRTRRDPKGLVVGRFEEGDSE